MAAVLAEINDKLPLALEPLTFCKVMMPLTPVISNALVPATVISLL